MSSFVGVLRTSGRRGRWAAVVEPGVVVALWAEFCAFREGPKSNVRSSKAHELRLFIPPRVSRPGRRSPYHKCGMRERASRLNALHGKHHEVVNERDLFLHEGFGVADAGEQAEMTRGREGALADVIFRDEEATACLLIAVLGAIGEQRG